MALIPCPHCGTEFSDAAPTCPGCGRPNDAHVPAPPLDVSPADGASDETLAFAPADAAGPIHPAGPADPIGSTGPAGSMGTDAGGTGPLGADAGDVGSSAGDIGTGDVGPGGTGSTGSGDIGTGGTGGGGTGFGGNGGGGTGTGGTGGAGAPQEKIPNYLVPAVILTLCCCQPVAIVALVFAAQVNSKRDRGDIAGARDSSRKARLWLMISVALWVVGVGVAIAFGFLGVILAALSGGG